MLTRSASTSTKARKSARRTADAAAARAAQGRTRGARTGAEFGTGLGTSVGSSVGAAVGAGLAVAGPVVERVGEQVGERVEQATPYVEQALTRAGEQVVRVRENAGPLVDRARAGAVPLAAATSGAVSEVLDDARVRGGAAWEALRGDRVGPPVAVRRWPWALTAALVGASAGAALAYVLKRLGQSDAPGAQEPHEVQAVVDRAAPVAPMDDQPATTTL